MAEGLIDYYYYFMVQALQGKYSYLTPNSTFSSYPWKEPERETILDLCSRGTLLTSQA